MPLASRGCVIHIAIAVGSVHEWSHAAAIEATAIQTESVYGLRWGGGVFVNYLFAIVWALEAWWRTRSRAFSESRFARWMIRTFYVVVVFNAAVVFARGSTRAAGAVLVAGVPPGVAAAPALTAALRTRVVESVYDERISDAQAAATGLSLDTRRDSTTLLADNWPHWRGPTHDGVSKETGLPIKWSAT